MAILSFLGILIVSVAAGAITCIKTVKKANHVAGPDDWVSPIIGTVVPGVIVGMVFFVPLCILWYIKNF